MVTYILPSVWFQHNIPPIKKSSQPSTPRHGRLPTNKVATPLSGLAAVSVRPLGFCESEVIFLLHSRRTTKMTEEWSTLWGCRNIHLPSSKPPENFKSANDRRGSCLLRNDHGSWGGTIEPLKACKIWKNIFKLKTTRIKVNGSQK